MMGRQNSGQDRLFYSFNLEAHVPQDHLLRSIDRHLDRDNYRLNDGFSPRFSQRKAA